MQDRYVGDIGDFGKYGLLKAIRGYDPACRNGVWSLGVVWYRTPDGGNAGDGTHIAYLSMPAGENDVFRQCDPLLYATLKSVVVQKQRCVSAIRNRSVLGSNVVFYEEPLTFTGMPHIGKDAREMRLAHRNKWLQGALQTTAYSDVVFLDPDNGISSPSHQQHHTAGPRYVFLDELAAFINRGQTAVVYHHLHRNTDADTQISERLNELGDKFSQQSISVLLFRRYTLRAYFIVSDPCHNSVIDARLKAFLAHGWHTHFDMIST